MKSKVIHILNHYRLRLVLPLLILAVLLTVLTTGCANRNTPYTTSDFIMGTYIIQKIYGEDAETASEKVRSRLKEIENRMTVNKPGGEINHLNDMAGIDKVILSSDTYYVIKEGLFFSELSNGAFDITIGPVVKLWGGFTEDKGIPEWTEIAEKLKLVDYRGINLVENPPSAGLPEKGQLIDLGAIAKGFAGDEAINIYRNCGIESAYINLGGNTVVLGSKPDGSPWQVAIQNPRGEHGTYIGVVPVVDKTVVTSGDYERYFIKDGKRYHHIIDPATGYPAESGLTSVTVITDKSIKADALSTSLFVLGLDKGMELVKRLDHVEAIFITSDKEIYVSSGLEDTFIFDDESGEYTYVQER